MPARLSRWLLPLTLVALVAACTNDTTELDDAAADDEAADEAAATYIGAVDELDLTIPEALAASEATTFAVGALDRVGSEALATGDLSDGGAPRVPAVFGADAGDPVAWQQRGVLLPDGYVSGTASVVDAPDVIVASHLDDDRQRHTSLWTKDRDPEQIALIDTHNPVTVNNVFEHDDDLVAVGRIVVEGARVPAAWLIDEDGQVEHIDVSDFSDRGFLSSGVVHDDVVHLFGVDLTTDETFYARGDAPDTAEVTEMPGPLADARRIHTAVTTGDAIWLGGSRPGGATGYQALWSYDGDGGGRELSRTLWRGDAFSSSISRLVAHPAAVDDGDMVMAVDAGESWWVVADGRALLRSGHFGGQAVAYTADEDWLLTYDGRTDEFVFDGEPIETDIPTSRAQAGVPSPYRFVEGFTLVGTGWDDARTALVRDGESVVTVAGEASLQAVDDLMVAFGVVSPATLSQPLLAVIEDGEAVVADLDVDEDAGSTRLRTLVDRGDASPAVYGHQWDAGRLDFYGFEYDDGEWVPIERPDGLEEGRAVTHDCGTRAFISYSADGENGIGVADGSSVIDMLLPPDLNAQSAIGCSDGAADGTVYFAAADDLARFDPATGDIDLVTPDDDVETFHGIDVVHDGETVVAIGSLYDSPGVVSAWAAPVDEPGAWQRLDAVETPVGMTGLRLLGVDDDNVVIGGMYGNDARAWTVSVEQG